MTKQEFLSSLRGKLQGLPQQDIDERVSFYEEMINDRIDEGKSEEEAVNELGNVDDVVRTIVGDTSLVKLVKHKMTPKRKMRGWGIVLLILGFPLWFPLALTALILLLVGYSLIWVLVIVTYSIEIALVVCSTTSGISFLGYLLNKEMNLAPLGSSIMCAGAAILLIFGCIAATKGTIKIAKGLVTSIKMIFIRKGDK